jgi:tRNA threonylcarbamoyl adenosine modification protein YeaZ
MIAAAFETSTRSSSVALGLGSPEAGSESSLGDAGTFEFFTSNLDGGTRHASDLLPILDELLREQGLGAKDLDAVLVGTGPGSYTGLRVSVATALGLVLGEVGGKTPQLLGVPSCEALLAGNLNSGETGAWIQDARSGGFYVAQGALDVGLILDTQPSVVDQEGLEQFLAASSATRVFGDEATQATLDKIGVAAALEFAIPDAEQVLRLGLPRLAESGPIAPGDLAPLYLRPFAVKVRKR